MRVLIVASRYLPHRGGVETVSSHLAQELVRKGHEVLVVAQRYPRRLPAREVIEGIQIRRLMFLYPRLSFLRQGRIDLAVASVWYLLSTTWVLHRIVHTFQPDVVNLHYLGSPGCFLNLAHSLSAFPWVVSLHGGDVDGEPYGSRHGRRLFETVTAKAKIVTACSKALAEEAVRLSGSLRSKLQVIHNGVDTRLFASAPPYRHPVPYFAAVGQLVEHKGFDLLIDAFADVATDSPGVDLIIAGDGACGAKLRDLARQRGVQGRVHFLGRVSETQVASLIAGSLFVAMPSRREPFGIVALEAMAAGHKVLAAHVGGVSEFVNPDYNRLVAPDRSSWRQALAEALQERSNGVSHANRAWAEQFRWDRVAARYVEAYHEAISTG